LNTTIVDIFLIVLILSASALCIFVIIYLKRIFEEVAAVRKDIHNLVENTIPILGNLEEVSQRANRIVTEAEEYWEEIDRSIKTLREKIANFGSWKKFRNAQTQTSDLIKNLKAIAKGISAFWSEFKYR
jgi:uncharacterized protein YoxC